MSFVLRSVSKSSTVLRSSSKICGILRPFSTTTPTQQPLSAGDRLIQLMDFFKTKEVGMFNQLYHARIHFSEQFDDGCLSDPEFLENWLKTVAVICSMDGGISGAEKNAIWTEFYAWNPRMTRQEVDDMCESVSKMSESELQKLVDRVCETYTMEWRRALLLNCLCCASSDRLDITEIEQFLKIAQKLKVDGETAQKIYSLYSLEKELKVKYDEFYGETYDDK